MDNGLIAIALVILIVAMAAYEEKNKKRDAKLGLRQAKLILKGMG